MDITPPGGGPGRWEVRRTTFRLGGLPHDLLVLSDVSRPLREQERQAWQRLIRVIGHELGNSLGPIRSIAGSLDALLQRNPPPTDWRDDMQKGLQVIASRTDSLSRFTSAYSRLARLPAPRLAPVVLKPLLQRVAGFDSRVPVHIGPGPDVTIEADADQLEQLLINVLRNAADACLEVGGGKVTLSWRRTRSQVEIRRRRRRARTVEHGQPVRALLHDEARRIGNRPRALPSDRRGTRRIAQAREPNRRSGLSRDADAAGVISFSLSAFNYRHERFSRAQASAES